MPASSALAVRAGWARVVEAEGRAAWGGPPPCVWVEPGLSPVGAKGDQGTVRELMTTAESDPERKIPAAAAANGGIGEPREPQKLTKSKQKKLPELSRGQSPDIFLLLNMIPGCKTSNRHSSAPTRRAPQARWATRPPPRRRWFCILESCYLPREGRTGALRSHGQPHSRRRQQPAPFLTICAVGALRYSEELLWERGALL